MAAQVKLDQLRSDARGGHLADITRRGICDIREFQAWIGAWPRREHLRPDQRANDRIPFVGEQNRKVRRRCGGRDRHDVEFRGVARGEVSSPQDTVPALRVPPEPDPGPRVNTGHAASRSHRVQDVMSLSRAHQILRRSRGSQAGVVSGGYYPPGGQEVRESRDVRLDVRSPRRRAVHARPTVGCAHAMTSRPPGGAEGACGPGAKTRPLLTAGEPSAFWVPYRIRQPRPPDGTPATLSARNTAPRAVYACHPAGRA